MKKTEHFDWEKKRKKDSILEDKLLIFNKIQIYFDEILLFSLNLKRLIT